MASNRIKGITIEIDGNTTKLTDSLKKVDSSLKNTQSQLKDVNKLLKFNPGNTDLLAQKQTLLAKSVKETTERSEELKKALADMDAKGVNHTSDQYQALQREIIETDSKLANLTKTQTEFGTVASQQIQIAGGKITDLGGNVDKVGSKLTTGLTVPLTAVGAAAIAAFNEVDAGADAIATKTGASGKALSDMQEQMQNIATTIPTTFEDAGNAIGEVNTKFGVSGDTLEQLSTQFIEFAKINNTDVTTSIDSVQSVMAAFGISTDDAGKVLDTMNSVGQKTGISMDTLASSLSTNAASLQEMGLNAYDSATFLGEVEVSGADTTAVMAGLKKALTNAAAEGKPMSQALSEIQDEMQNGTDSTKVMNDAVDLFGSKAAPQIVNACKNGTLSFKDLSGSANDAAGSVSNTFEETLDPIDEWQLTLNKLKVSGAKLGNSLSKVLQPALEKVGDISDDLSSWFDGLSDEEKDQVVNLGLMAAAAGPVLKVAGTGITTIGSVVKGIGSLTGSIATFSDAISEGTGVAGALTTVGLNPMALAITGVVAAYGTLAVAAKTSHDNWLQQIEDQYGLTDSAKELISRTDEMTKSWSDLKSAQEENVTGVESQYAHYQDLADEYDTLIDSNGQVKAGEEDRANFITSTLADAFGVEQSDIQELIDKNGNLGDSIDGLMEKQKAQAVLSTYTDQYTEAVKNQQQAVKDLAQYTEEYSAQEAKVKQAKEDATLATENYNKAAASSTGATQEQYDAMITATTAYSTSSGELQKLKNKQDEANTALIGYNSTIADYEGVSSAIMSGDTASITDSLNKLQNGFITAETGDRTSLENQTKDLQDQLAAMQKAVNDGAPGITQAQVDEMSNLVNQSKAELDKLPATATDEGTAYKDNMTDQLNQAANNGKDAAAKQNAAAKSTNLGQAGKDQGSDYKTNLNNQEQDAVQKNRNNMNTVSNDAKNTKIQMGSSVKLPHFSLKGKFSLDPLQIPSVSVSWYKKAMQNPYLLSGATIFGQAANGSLLGGGEAGNEVIMSEDRFKRMGSSTVNNSFTIVQQPGQDTHALAVEIGRIITNQTKSEGSTWK
jgi:phage-related minor tail protein